MKKLIFLLCLISGSAFASDCETALLERINKDPKIKVLKILDHYTCGQSACAVIYEHGNSSYEKAKALGYLDRRHDIKINMAPFELPFQLKYASGKVPYDQARVAYVVSELTADETHDLVVLASIETDRDAFYGLFHRTTYSEKLRCTQD